MGIAQRLAPGVTQVLVAVSINTQVPFWVPFLEPRPCVFMAKQPRPGRTESVRQVSFRSSSREVRIRVPTSLCSLF